MFEKTSYRSGETASIRGLFIFIWNIPGFDIRPVCCFCPAGGRNNNPDRARGDTQQSKTTRFRQQSSSKKQTKAAGRKICYNYPEKKELKKKAACRQDGQEADLRELYPAHYTCFHCIAASCDFSCCRDMICLTEQSGDRNIRLCCSALLTDRIAHESRKELLP